VCLLALLPYRQVTAQVATPLTLAEAEELALREEPGQSALQARADSLQEQAIAAGQLPDPVLRIGIANYPIESGGFTTEGMTQGQLGFRQSFPPGKTRSLSTHQFQALSAEMDWRAIARARDVLTSVRTAWLDAYYWERAHAVVSDSRPYFDDLVTVTRSLYGVGKKNQQDVLRAELELSRLDDRLIEIERQRRTASAALSQWIGPDAIRSIAHQPPAWDRVPAPQTLRDELARHPAVLASDAKIDARTAEVQLAEERYKPGWAVDLGYGYRDGFMPDGSPRSDFVSVSVMVDLPIFRRNRQDRNLGAALSERRAAQESREGLLRRLSSQLEGELARWQELTRRIELYERRLVVQAADQARAALAAYRSEAGDFDDVMRGVVEKLNVQLDLERLQTEQRKSYAVLANLGGFPHD
tara:strand:+ start:1988 stop:3229 length:1242 start_codon:yes stop_codon:yes gene_type:complete